MVSSYIRTGRGDSKSSLTLKKILKEIEHNMEMNDNLKARLYGVFGGAREEKQYPHIKYNEDHPEEDTPEIAYQGRDNFVQLMDQIRDRDSKVFRLCGIDLTHKEFEAEDYCDSAMRFWQGGFKGDPLFVSNDVNMPMLINGVMGLTGEAGEVSEPVKKYLFQGHDLDVEHLAKELGDVCWYLNLAAYAIGLDIPAIMEKNIQKLEARYPDGHFESDRSIHRKEGDD